MLHLNNKICLKKTFVYLSCAALFFTIYKYNVLHNQLKKANFKLKAAGEIVEEDESESSLTKVLANLVAIAL